jgi:hypothetical protein
LRTDSGVVTWYAEGVGTDSSGVTLTVNTWHHVAVKRTGTTISFVIDGTVSGNTFTRNSDYNSGGSGTFSIGGTAPSGAGENFLGYISDVAVWDTAITDAKLQAIYNDKTFANATDSGDLVAYYPLSSDYTDQENTGTDYDLTTAGNTTISNTVTTPIVNLQENTLFEETDTQTQYWLQTLDGTVDWFPTWYDTFVKDRGWTAYNSSTNTVDTTNEWLNVISIEPFSIEIPELDTKWVCDLDIRWVTIDGNQRYVFFTNYNATKYNVSTGTPQYIGLRGSETQQNGETLRITNYDGGETNDGDQYMTSPASVANTWYYYRIVRNGDDVTLTRHTTDANRRNGVAAATETYSNFVGAVSWDEDVKIKYIVVGGYGGANFEVKNIRVYNGVTSI